MSLIFPKFTYFFQKKFLEKFKKIILIKIQTDWSLKKIERKILQNIPEKKIEKRL